MTTDPFARLDEIATVLPPDRWMLVGGLMVHAHAQLAALPHVHPFPLPPMRGKVQSAG
jgi:hypothetical protein